MKSVRIIVTGRVQGVAFRYYTREKATKLGLTGTVQNQPDGTVKIYAYGNADDIEIFSDWCYIGSPASRVDTVEIINCTLDQSNSGFRIVR